MDAQFHNNMDAYPGAEPEHLSRMVAQLAEADGPCDEAGVWPDRLWRVASEASATRWAIPQALGGEGCDRPELIRRYVRMAQGSLTAAFILSQHDAAVRRLVAVVSERPRSRHWLDAIASGRAFTTVGISHLTTSRRHGGSRALVASATSGGGFRLEGTIPWVTGAERAAMIVTAAVLDDGRQLLIALPTDRPGLSVQPPFALAALQASCTAEVRCEGVTVDADDLLDGPEPDVMARPKAASTGGLETSALALGQARAALEALRDVEASQRNDLAEPIEALDQAWTRLWTQLRITVRDAPDALSPAQIRSQANALVLRLTQAYLTVRKGTGFLRHEPAQRWARQALFFLVWSCPAPVARAALLDLAGLCQDSSY